MKNNIFFLVLITAFVACNSKSTPDEATETAEIALAENVVEMTDEQLKTAQLGLQKGQNRIINSTLRVNGKVDVPPHNLVSVSFPIGGYLKSSNLLEGMHVKKGQTLAILEDPTYVQIQQDYLTAQAKVDFLQTEITRQQVLAKEQINAGKTLQQVQSDLRLQQIMVKGLSEKLRFIGINPDNLTIETITRTAALKSPITGYVSKVNVSPGKYLAPTDILFELVDPDDIHAELTVFEKDLPKISIGQSVKISVPSLPNEAHNAKIILIGRTLDEARSSKIHCHFDKQDHSLSPGMFLTAEIQTANAEAFSIENEAIIRFENRFFVFVSNDAHHFDIIEVQLGAANNTFTQITPTNRGIQLTQQNIVVKNAYTLLQKMKNTAE